jgi:hypothetical protein
MASVTEDTSNSALDLLADWNKHLEQQIPELKRHQTAFDKHSKNSLEIEP